MTDQPTTVAENLDRIQRAVGAFKARAEEFDNELQAIELAIVEIGNEVGQRAPHSWPPEPWHWQEEDDRRVLLDAHGQHIETVYPSYAAVHVARVERSRVCVNACAKLNLDALAAVVTAFRQYEMTTGAQARVAVMAALRQLLGEEPR